MESGHLFGAPTASAAHSTGGGLASVTLALILIVALIWGIAWIFRRWRGLPTGGAQGRIQVLSQHSLGVKERCVLVRIGATDILIGIAPGNVRTLHVFPEGASTDAPPAPTSDGSKLPNFKDLLMRSLGK
jgi:flagellar protein FliO/FliZ